MAQRGGKRAGAGRPVGSKEIRTAFQDQAREAVQVFTSQRVLEEIAALAFSDIGALFDERGQMLPIRKMPEQARRALASAKTTLFNEPGKKDGVQEYVREVKLWSKPDVLRLAAQYHGMLVETKVDATNDKDIRARMRRGEERARQQAK